ncbi:MAG: Ig-like domain-containing protein, partial [Alcanivorax sp.]|nr:Ig-like domain-containing protein [Alcanivorax sp.]
RMIIDALGVVEPEVLGIETAFGVLSFHMESYLDQENAPAPPVDITGPSLQSWQPGDYADRFRPGDPIVLNLSETPDQDSIEAGVSVTLTDQGVAVPFEWTLDGASLILTPQQPLAFGTEYQVTLTDGVEDLHGNPATPETLLFSMPGYSADAPRTPYTTTVYPGFPCAVDPASRDLGNGIQGQCASAFQNQAGDLLPVDKMPANRPIEVQFSQDMDTSSMVLGQACGEGSVRVEKIDSAGNCLEAVPGYLSRNTRSLTVIPAQPWEEGVLYQYVLGSHENTGCGQDVICSVAGMPLQTAQLLAPAADAGGPDMAIAFTGAPATRNVFLPLRNLPKADVNANFEMDAGEQKAVEDPPGSGEYPTPTNAASLFVTGTGGLATGANVGCPLNQSCPGEKFTYLNGGINADIVGWNEAEQAVEVLLYPPVLMTTTSSVYAQILGLVEPEVPTEPLVMRARYADDGNG